MKVMEGLVWRRAGALREANFRKLWVGQTTSAFGDGMTGVALAFAVLAVSGSAADLGIVLASFMVPRVVFMLVGGVWADRLSRRAVMLGADLVRAAAQAGLAVAAFSGTHELWVFVIASAAAGAASAFFQPASTGLIPQTISDGRLRQANALLNLSQSTAFMVGPVVSGLVVAVAGAGWVFAFDAATFLVSTASLLALRLPASEPMERGTFLRDLADGWREVAARRWLVASLGAFAFGNLAFAGFFVLAPVTIDRLYAGASDWGLLMGCFGLGGVIGGALALRWRAERPLITTFAVLLAAPGALVLLGLTPPFAVLAAGVVVFAIGTAIANTLWHTTVQQQVPPASLSRVSSYDWMVSMLIFPLGSALAGPMADAFGARMALLVFAALAGVPLVLVLFHPAVRAVRAGAASLPADGAGSDLAVLSPAPGDRSIAA